MLLLALAFASASVSAVVTNCNTNSVFKITELVLDPPNTAVAGDNVTLKLLYNSPVVVDSGTITTSVTYNFIPLAPTKTDLCAFNCPITVGDHDASSWFVVPTGVKGNVVTKIIWTSHSELLCININLKVSWFKHMGKTMVLYDK